MAAMGSWQSNDFGGAETNAPNKPRVTFDQRELKARLTPMEFAVTQLKATERAYTGEYDQHFEKGLYHCVVCEEKLFSSEKKFDSGCGWPAFRAPAQRQAVAENEDRSHNMIRTEVTCANCGAHLGHVFDDGPPSAPARYCINSASLKFSQKSNNTNKD